MSQPQPPTWTVTARWVFPVAAPPLERGTVTIAGGRIAAVEPHGTRQADVDLGDVALLPGLVNAHTHLDLTGLRGRVPYAGDFTDWLRAVIRHRRGLSPEQAEADIRLGLRESIARGVTLVGDISGQGLSWPVLVGAPLRAVVFYELLGLPAERVRRAWSDFLHWSRTHPATATCRPGVSPHAPYSVRASVIRAAAYTGMPVAVHLAETAAERELLEHHRGPFVAFLEGLGAWDPTGLAKSPEDVLRLSRRASSVAFAHGNFLRPGAGGGVSPLFPRGGSVVYCPRTHAYFGHPPHPFRQLLARGVRVALGTDSLASNPDLDVLAEARFLHRLYPDAPGAQLLHLATLAGAEALGWGDEVGSLTPGKSADLVVAGLPPEGSADPHRLVLGWDLPVRRVLFRGRWVWPEGAGTEP
jgi:cytosine/adenosine deaminase-related metal-dependent hydrolase